MPWSWREIDAEPAAISYQSSAISVGYRLSLAWRADS